MEATEIIYQDENIIIRRNLELNGIEISNTQIPSSEVRNSYKDAGFHWHKQKKHWYAKETAETRAFVETLLSSRKTNDFLTEKEEFSEEQDSAVLFIQNKYSSQGISVPAEAAEQALEETDIRTVYAFTRKNNPELWNTGKEIFKVTHVWQETAQTKESKPELYGKDGNLDEDLVLEEICLGLAEDLISRIKDRDGEEIALSAEEWNRETLDYFIDVFLTKDDKLKLFETGFSIFDIAKVAEAVASRIPEIVKAEYNQEIPNPKTIAADFALETLRKTGVEIITDKTEFEKTLNSTETAKTFMYHMGQKDLFDDLKICFDAFYNSDFNSIRRLDDFGENYASLNLWKAAKGGYDKEFAIYYNNIEVIECVDGKVSLSQRNELEAAGLHPEKALSVIRSILPENYYSFDFPNPEIDYDVRFDRIGGVILTDYSTGEERYLQPGQEANDFIREFNNASTMDLSDYFHEDFPAESFSKKNATQFMKPIAIDYAVFLNRQYMEHYYASELLEKFSYLTDSTIQENFISREQLEGYIYAGKVGDMLAAYDPLALQRSMNSFLQKASMRHQDRETVYGFTVNDRIYLNPEILNANTPVHEYTHLWDKYIALKNPGLWNRGKEILSKTSLWDKIKNSPEYSDIKDDDDLILSEVHARISGTIAEKVLERIALEDGEITAEKVIQWNREAWTYVATEMAGYAPEELEANREFLSDFMAMPIRDMFAGVNPVEFARKYQRSSEKEIARELSREEHDSAETEEVHGVSREEEKSTKLTPEDIEICKKVIPPAQFKFTMKTMELTEGEFFRNMMKEIADTYRRINTDRELTNEDGTHNVGFRYFLGDTEIFLSEIDSDGIGFGYTVLNGDLEMSEWGYSSLEEIMEIPGMEMDYHVPDGMTIERMLYREHPDYFSEYAPEETEQEKNAQTFDFEKLADDLIQIGLERSTDPNCQIDFAEVAELAGKTEEWVKENIGNIREALSDHNDNELLDYPYDTEYEEIEGIIDLTFCSLDDGEMPLFRNENGRWIRKAEDEIALYYDVSEKLYDSYGDNKNEITDIKIYHPENYGFEKDDKIHVLVEYEGDANEDAVFNILNEEPLTADGKTVDCNPINIKKSGTVEEYLQKLSESENEEIEKVDLGKNQLFDNSSFEQENTKNQPATYRYRLLSRMQQDCEYYLGNGSRNPKHLWTGEEVQHIKNMVSLYNSFSYEDKPEWLSIDELDNYSKELTGKSLEEHGWKQIIVENNVFQEIPLTVNNADPYTDEIIEKIRAAGIEVVTDKDEFDRTREFIRNNRLPHQNLTMDWVYEKEIDYPPINRPSDILDLLQNYSKSPQEMFVAVSIDNQKKPVTSRIISVGTMNTAPVHPRDVFRDAIKNNAAAIIVAHNHPSGNIQPSVPDMETTKRLVDAGKILGVQVLDHIITSPSGGDYYSFRESGMIQEMNKQGITYGFVHDGKIYLDPELVSSNAAVHEYTHLWDAYTQKTNPELWNKGLEIFKDTKYWNEVISDPNYQDIKDDENLVLSEIHARIQGDIAGQVLKRIAELDGEQVKLDAIDWDKETALYIANNLLSDLTLPDHLATQGKWKDLDLGDLKRFLSTPLKDLVSEKNISVSNNGVSLDEEINPLHELYTKLEGFEENGFRKRLTDKTAREVREAASGILETKKDWEITEEDRKILSFYEGGGGLSEEGLATEEILFAFYTPDKICSAAWALADAYAPGAETVLEPSSGIGRFAEHRGNNRFTLRELNEKSARIAKILHPGAEVIQGEFQAQFFDENNLRRSGYERPLFDVVIGNPPYGEYHSFYSGLGEGSAHNRYEEYFIEEGLKSLKDENSVLVFVVPSSFLKNQEDNPKRIIASQGYLVDAYRLPNSTFDTTEIGTDIIVMKKGSCNPKEISSNNWFVRHPEKILGTIAQKTNRFGKLESFVKFNEGQTVDDVVAFIKENASKVDGYRDNTADEIWKPADKPAERNSPKKKTRIEQALNDYLAREPDPFAGNRKFYETYGIKGEIGKHLDASFLANRDWRLGNKIYGGRQIIIDPETGTKAVILRKDQTSDWYLLSTKKRDGTVTTFYDEAFFDSLTNLKKERITELAETEVGDRHVDNLIGQKEDTLYFRSSVAGDKDFSAHYAMPDSDISFFDTTLQEKKKFRTIGLVFDSPFPSEGDDWGYSLMVENGIVPVFCSFQTLFPENGEPNLDSVLEEDARFNSEINAVLPEYRTFVECIKETPGLSMYSYKHYLMAPYKEALKKLVPQKAAAAVNESGFKSWNEFTEHASFKAKEKKQKLLEKRIAYEARKEDEFPYNKFFAKFMSQGGFVISGKEQIVYDRICRQSLNPANKNIIDVFLDTKAAFAFDNKTRTLIAYNDFPVTEEFIALLYERYGSIKIDEQNNSNNVLNINEILKEKLKETRKSKETGQTAASLLIDHARNTGVPEYRTEIDSTELKTIRDNNIISLFVAGNNYAAASLDTKAKKLVLYQDSLETKTALPIEQEIRKALPDVSVEKRFTHEDNFYVDIDGATTLIPYKSETYVPAKKDLLSSESFAELYGMNWDKKEFPIWSAVDYDGHVDLNLLNEESKKLLKSSDNYLEEKPEVFVPKELYLSGNIYEKLDNLEELFSKSEISEELYQKNKKLLESVIPEPVQLAEMEINPREPFARSLSFDGKPATELFFAWVTASDQTDSPNSKVEIYDYNITPIARNDIPQSIAWSDVVSYVNGESLERIDDKTKTAEEIKELRAEKENDRRETAKRLFSRFLNEGLTEEQKKRLVYLYNRQYNSNRNPDYAKLPLFVSGMNRYKDGIDFKLYEQQIKGVSFLATKGNGLIAYDVGVGKTATGIVAAVTLIQTGRAKRPLIVAPKSVLPKWEHDIKELFPEIQVNVIGNGGRNDAGKYYDGNHGLIIEPGTITLATREVFTNMGITAETRDLILPDVVDLIGASKSFYSSEKTKKVQKEKEVAKLKAIEVLGLVSRMKDGNGIFFENTGFDAMIADEAHNFKNISSTRAVKFFAFNQIIQKKNNNRGVIELTATPFPKADPEEVYTMLNGICRQKLISLGIHDFDDFNITFGNYHNELAILPGNKIGYKDVMTSYAKPEMLQKIFAEYIDRKTTEEAGIIRPLGQDIPVYLEPSPLQEDLLEIAKWQIDQPPRDEDGRPTGAVLVGLNFMRMASLSPALADQAVVDRYNSENGTDYEVPGMSEIVTSSPKLKYICDTAVEVWNKGHDLGQILYIPSGTDAYRNIIDYMVDKGVPLNVFGTITGQECTLGGKQVKLQKNDEAEYVREKVCNCFNDPKNPCKILLGSRAILEGVDLNGNTIATYDSSLEWNPGDTVQLKGRAQRQGNSLAKTFAVFPLVEKSSDSVMYQLHQEKGLRADDLYNSKTVENLEIKPEEVKFKLLTDPYALAKMDIDREVKSMQKDLLIIQNQISDYDSIGESRKKWQDTLKEREQKKNQYINKYNESLFGKTPVRTPEEQQEGLNRFDASIRSAKACLKNTEDKYRMLGLKNMDEATDYSLKLQEKAREKERLIEEFKENKEYRQSLVDFYRKKIDDEKEERLNQALKKPLSEIIIEARRPFHELEHEVKEARYKEALKLHPEKEQELRKEWEQYEAQYNKKWRAEGKQEEQIPEPEKPELKIEPSRDGSAFAQAVKTKTIRQTRIDEYGQGFFSFGDEKELTSYRVEEPAPNYMGEKGFVQEFSNQITVSELYATLKRKNEKLSKKENLKKVSGWER